MLHAGSVPGEFGQWAKIPQLVVSYNKLNGSLSDALGNLTSIKGLGLNDNQLMGQLPASWGISAIANTSAFDGGLNLANNLLTGPVPATWAGSSSRYVNARLRWCLLLFQKALLCHP